MESWNSVSLSLWLKKCIQDKFGYEWDQINTSMANLGYDSINSVELLAKVEDEFGISFPAETLYKINQTDDLFYEILARIGKDNVDFNVNDYTYFVNPYLADKLDKLKIARSFVKASGAYLYDSEGGSYLDFLSQYGAAPFGHHPEEIWQTIRDFHENGEPIFSQPSLLHSAGKLGKALISHAPESLRYVTFTNSGAESVEAALKMARNVTGRTGVLSTRNSFHGKTFGALSATTNPEYQHPFGLPLPGFDAIAYNSLPELESILYSNPEKYACFIVEPIQGEGGVVVPGRSYLHDAHEICKRFGVVFIVDEIQTGMGRTGNIFFCNELGVNPDIILVSKALGGGMIPIGAVLSSENIYTEKFALKHSSTFAGNSLAARVGLATLELLTRNDNEILKNIRERGFFLKSELEKIQKEFPQLIKEVRGQGLMLGLRFTTSRSIFSESFLSLAAEQKELTQLIASYLLNVENIRVAPTLNKGDVLRIQPPYNVTHKHCEEFINSLRRMMKVLSKGEMGVFYKSILARKECSEELTLGREKGELLTVADITENSARFAFIIHPLDELSYVDYDKTLNTLTESELNEFSKSMNGIFDPIIGSQVTLVSETGAVAHGDFIMICYTAKQLLAMPVNEAIKELKKAIQLAIRRGARIVGLGAYTSIVSAGGELLVNREVALTSGNSFTVYAAVEALKLAMTKKNLKWENAHACVIGAAGAIGSCMSVMLSLLAPRLILIGNPAQGVEKGRERLLSVARDLIQYAIENEIHGLQVDSIYKKIRNMLNESRSDKEIMAILESEGIIIISSNISSAGIANLVITTTSSPESSLEVGSLRPNAIVLDISRPRTVTKEIAMNRPDITVLDGGIISLPGQAYVGPYGIAKGSSYACMAETILLALEKKYENRSIGKKLNIEDVVEQGKMAEKHGLHVGELQSFGKLLDIS